MKKKFISKPKVIEAEQFTKDNHNPEGLCLYDGCRESLLALPHVHTAHNNQSVVVCYGDWIVQEPDGVHYYPIKDEIFKKSYEPYKE